MTITHILSLAEMDPEFEQLLDHVQLPPPDEDMETMKARLDAVEIHRAESQSHSGIVEEDTSIDARDGFRIPIRIHRPSNVPPDGAPLIIMYHGGGFCIGSRQGETANCREFVQRFGAICVNVEYRLAPEYLFPTSVHDAWDALHWVAANFTTSPHIQGAAPSTKGFVVGGTGAGGNLAAVMTHLAHQADLRPRLTGQYLCTPSLLPPEVVPERYKAEYLSYEQNANAPLLEREKLNVLVRNYQPDPWSPLYAPFNDPTGHAGVPPAYIQVCGLDPLRDEALIYENVLRTEHGIDTRLDVYPGLPHAFWMFFPQLSMTRKFQEDTVRGLAWLLGQGR